MLLSFAQFIHNKIKFLYILDFLIFRSIISILTSSLITIIIGNKIIYILNKIKAKQIIRNDGPKMHLIKSGTPTMGGIIILFSIIISVLLWSNLNNTLIWILLITMISFGLIGLIDDFKKILKRNSYGLSVYKKYILQSFAALSISIYLALFFLGFNNIEEFNFFISKINNNIFTEISTKINLFIPFFNKSSYSINIISFIIISYFVIVGTSNSVNLTDGLDGLAIVPVVLISLSLGIFSYITGNLMYSKYFSMPYIYGADELIVFCSAIAGSGIAFLLFNIYPAKIFMGDVGSLSLGGVIGIIAVILRQEMLLFLIGGVFVIEAVSVIMQVIWFKYTKIYYGKGKRIFKMTPLHHHFELLGYKETNIVIYFWIITFMLCFFGILTLKLF